MLSGPGSRRPQKPPVGAALGGNSYTQGMAFLYALNEGTGPYASDASRAGPTLTFQEPAASWTASSYGWAASFPEAANYASGGASAIAKGKPFSIATSFAPAVASQSGGIVSLANSPSATNPLFLLTQAGTVIEALIGAVAYRTLVSAAAAGQWYTVASIWDGANETYYLNGSPVYSGARSLGGVSTPLLTYLGTGYQGIWKGSMGWAAGWTRALSGAEAAAITGGPTAIFGLICSPRYAETRYYAGPSAPTASYRGRSVLRPAALTTADILPSYRG